MTRLRSNVRFGAISDSPLSAGATTINSTQFAGLPVVAGGDDLVLTLDPAAVYGDPEIVRVTAHTSSATSVTVVRGHDNTTPRQHQAGVPWVNPPVTEDVIVQCTSTTRPTVGLYVGMRIFETDTSRELRYTGTDWQSFVEPYLPDVGWTLYR